MKHYPTQNQHARWKPPEPDVKLDCSGLDDNPTKQPGRYAEAVCAHHDNADLPDADTIPAQAYELGRRDGQLLVRQGIAFNSGLALTEARMADRKAVEICGEGKTTQIDDALIEIHGHLQSVIEQLQEIQAKLARPSGIPDLWGFHNTADLFGLPLDAHPEAIKARAMAVEWGKRDRELNGERKDD